MYEAIRACNREISLLKITLIWQAISAERDYARGNCIQLSASHLFN